jgi:hypothetical protein
MIVIPNPIIVLQESDNPVVIRQHESNRIGAIERPGHSQQHRHQAPDVWRRRKQGRAVLRGNGDEAPGLRRAQRRLRVTLERLWEQHRSAELRSAGPNDGHLHDDEGLGNAGR